MLQKLPPVMRHIIRELPELAGMNSRSQQASAAQGYNVLCRESCERCIFGRFNQRECCAQIALCRGTDVA